MKKTISTLVFILVGSLSWWTLSNSARLSIKKWDAKYNTLLRHQLDHLGWSDEDVVSSVNQLKKSDDGVYLQHQWVIRNSNKKQIKALKKLLEKSGAHVESTVIDKNPTLLLKRGNRIYQEIQFL